MGVKDSFRNVLGKELSEEGLGYHIVRTTVPIGYLEIDVEEYHITNGRPKLNFLKWVKNFLDYEPLKPKNSIALLTQRKDLVIQMLDSSYKERVVAAAQKIERGIKNLGLELKVIVESV